MMTQLHNYSLQVIPARCSLLPLISILWSEAKNLISVEQVVPFLYPLLLACAHPSMYMSFLL